MFQIKIRYKFLSNLFRFWVFFTPIWSVYGTNGEFNLCNRVWAFCNLFIDAMVLSVLAVRRGFPRLKWFAGPRTMCTTWSASPAWCVADSSTRATSSTSWKTGSWSVRRTTSRLKPGASMVGPVLLTHTSHKWNIHFLEYTITRRAIASII